MTKIRIITAALALAALAGCGGAPAPVHTTAPATRRPTAAPPTSSRPSAAPTTGQPSAHPTVPPVSVEQHNATRSAQDYLQSSGFSRKGLIKQLAYEGFSSKAATAAVDSLNVDWNAQAVAVAKSYLDGQGFSRKGLINQLEYEGFSPAEATYGAKGAGL